MGSEFFRGRRGDAAAPEEPPTAIERLLADAEWVDGDESIWAPLRAEARREALSTLPGAPSAWKSGAPAPTAPGHARPSVKPPDALTATAPSAPRAGAPEGFDSLIAEAVRESKPRRSLLPFTAPRGPNRWGLVAAVGVVLLGAGLTGAAAFALQQHEADEARRVAAQAEAEAPATPPSVPQNQAGLADAPDEEDEGVTALVDTAWADPLAAEAGIPTRAMRAYAGAAIKVKEDYPECGLGWNTLAGIGFVESEHGTIDGGSIADNGRASPPILGIPLDGTSTDRIPDTDGGALDGDDVWDRAVGPMQFIPSTWADWAADGNGDGIEDPQNIDDSALAAARYLCETGGDLSQPDNWIAAVAAYNDTVDYNNRVADAADLYASFG